ncbi:hypothetical protein GE061_009610 [Apolygus lucorum]|uniref:Uncharacterized protein n=1 Tax=Apolygus lucorum TaxID=248454 RepID=A0A6A4K035_APOLU|nr:hypothetical protein GE061_009610 [Apolygus lucorum]
MWFCGCGLLTSSTRRKVSSERPGITARLAETPKSTAVALGASLFVVIGKYYFLWEWGKRRLLQRCHWGTQMRHMAVVNEEHKAGHRLLILHPPKSPVPL